MYPILSQGGRRWRDVTSTSALHSPAPPGRPHASPTVPCVPRVRGQRERGLGQPLWPPPSNRHRAPVSPTGSTGGAAPTAGIGHPRKEPAVGSDRHDKYDLRSLTETDTTSVSSLGVCLVSSRLAVGLSVCLSSVVCLSVSVRLSVCPSLRPAAPPAALEGVGVGTADEDEKDDGRPAAPPSPRPAGTSHALLPVRTRRDRTGRRLDRGSGLKSTNQDFTFLPHINITVQIYIHLRLPDADATTPSQRLRDARHASTFGG